MKATDEQKEIIQHKGNLVVEAFAGCGKTTVLTEKSKAYPDVSKLYVVYNKSSQIEGEKKFKEEGVEKAKVTTIHSLAYKAVGHKYEMVDGGNYRPGDIIDLFNLSYNDKDDLLLATYLLRLYNFYVNSAYESVAEPSYPNIWKKSSILSRGADFVSKNEDKLVANLKKFWTKMDSGEIPIDHNFYLKKYQLSKPKLKEKLIMLDEMQDSSDVVLDIMLRQEHADKILVGDKNQSLYFYRHAINALEKVDYDRLYLTGSFRFGKNIEQLASKILKWKQTYLKHKAPAKSLEGLGPKAISNYAILCRTNSGVLDRAIQAVFFDKQKVAYEGNLSSYMFASDSSSIYDVLNFYCNKRQYIKSKLFQSFTSWEDLVHYAEEADDMELQVQIKIVQKYGGQLYIYLKELKEKAVEKKNADIIISTVHKAKGQEYGHVTLNSDFRSAAWVKTQAMVKFEGTPKQLVEEEINVNYVAVTRAANNIELPITFFEETREKEVLDSMTEDERKMIQNVFAAS